MIRDPSPTIVAYDLQAALIRCGIKVEDKEFAYAAALAMRNLARAWLYGAGQIVGAVEDECDAGTLSLAGCETTADILLAVMFPLRQRFEVLTAAPSDTRPWLGAEDRQIIDAVAAVGPEGRDFCPRFGWGLNFPPPAEQAEAGAVALDPPCALAEHGCLNALLPNTGYAAGQPYPCAGWRAARAGHDLTAAASRARTSEAVGAPASEAASAAAIASAVDPTPPGDDLRSDASTAGSSTPRNVEGFTN